MSIKRLEEAQGHKHPPTNLSKRLREFRASAGHITRDCAETMGAAADELDRRAAELDDNLFYPPKAALKREDWDASTRKPKVRAAATERSEMPADEQFDFHAHLARQAAWSEKTFGPGARTAGVCDHIRKELIEIESDPSDLKEWIDVVILALDGAWRCGGKPGEIIAQIVAKQTKNEGRNWPDWRTADPNKAIEHDRTGEQAAPTDNSSAAPSNERVSPHDVCRETERFYKQRINELEAARIAYASEFPPDAEGDPDVGNIHANIRALKKQLAAPSPTGESLSAPSVVPEGWRIVEKKTHYQLNCGNDVIATLTGPAAEENASIIARAIAAPQAAARELTDAEAHAALELTKLHILEWRPDFAPTAEQFSAEALRYLLRHLSGDTPARNGGA
jgi:hypothetical protein